MYTIPTGGNPSGISATVERKKQVYEIACRHNLLILEDDPYYYLKLDQPSLNEPLGASYFSMDTQGRVLRFDSISKILSSGLRIGWASGPKSLIERIGLHAQSTNLHVSGVSQSITAETLKSLGYIGFRKHCFEISKFYKQRRDVAVHAAKQHLFDLTSFSIPEAGMFLFFKVNGVKDTRQLASLAVERGVLIVPGAEFFAYERDSDCFRVSYSTASDEAIHEAMKNLRSVILDCMKV